MDSQLTPRPPVDIAAAQAAALVRVFISKYSPNKENANFSIVLTSIESYISLKKKQKRKNLSIRMPIKNNILIEYKLEYE